MITQDVECHKCGSFVIEGNCFEDIRDAIAEHLMLRHGATEWVEENLPEGVYGNPTS